MNSCISDEADATLVNISCKTIVNRSLQASSTFLLCIALLSGFGLQEVYGEYVAIPPTNSTYSAGSPSPAEYVAYPVPNSTIPCSENPYQEACNTATLAPGMPYATLSPTPTITTTAPVGGVNFCDKCELGGSNPVDVKSELRNISETFANDYGAALQDIVCKPEDEPACSEAKKSSLAGLEKYKAAAAKTLNYLDKMACIQNASGLDSNPTCSSGISTRQRRVVQTSSWTDDGFQNSRWLKERSTFPPVKTVEVRCT
jgi:hypothetical protein